MEKHAPSIQANDWQGTGIEAGTQTLPTQGGFGQKSAIECQQSRHERTDWRIELIEAVAEERWRHKDNDELSQFSSFISDGIATDHMHMLQAQLLDQLSHADFQDRESRIKAAHARTFKWVLEPLTTENENSWSSLVNWLESDEKIYWITGKPGSGKSTLLKYICKDPRTQKYLRNWAKSQPLIEASFYFWNSGSSIQMSQDGLLRSLLYQALRAKPSLISSAFPRRWQISDLLWIDNRQWELSELQEGLRVVMRQAAEAPFKLCLFIDGMDEFSGNHKDFVEFVKSSGNYENVKLCIASRPWVVFEDGFAQGPNLRLQDLTYPDIFAFTTESLQSSSDFRSLQIRESNFGSQLVADISRKSCGVFLWVALVVKSLIEDISDCVRICDLQKRLEDIPDELEDLYRKMLDSIDTNYVEHAFQLFSITREAQGRLSVLALSFADDGDDTSLIDRKLGQMSDEEGVERYRVVKRRLMSRCKGFLEITNDQQNELGKGQDAIWTKSDIQLWNQKITYLHRTARDFLESAPIRELIALEVGKMLDAPLRLLRSGIFILKTMSDEQISLKKSYIWDVVDTTLNYGARAEKNLGCPQIRLIDEIDETMRQHAAADDSMSKLQSGHWSALRPGAQTNNGFLALAAQFNLQLYIREKIKINVPIFSGNTNRPLLDYIITDHDKYQALAERLTLGNYSMPNLNLLRILLKRGSDPNQVYKSKTHWETVLAHCIEISRNSDIPGDIAIGLLEHWSNVVELFIDHGANPLVNHDSPIYSRIREAFGDFQPDRARYLEKKISRSKTRMLTSGTLPTRPPSTNDLDLTPFPLWNKQHSLEFPGLVLSERIKRIPLSDRMPHRPYTWDTQRHDPLRGDNPDFFSAWLRCEAPVGVAYTGPSSTQEEYSLTHEESPSSFLNNMPTTQDAEEFVSTPSPNLTIADDSETELSMDFHPSPEVVSGNCLERRDRTQRGRAGGWNSLSNARLMEGPLVQRRRTVDQNTEQASERSPRYPLDNLPTVRDVPTARSITNSPAPEELANGTCGSFDNKTLSEFSADKCRYADDFMKNHKSTYERVIRKVEDEPSTPGHNSPEPTCPDQGSRIKVAILDTGLDRRHPFIQARNERIKDIRSWVNNLDGKQDPSTGDVSGHGTHVADLLLDVAPDCDVYIARIAEYNPIGPDLIAKAVMHAVTEWKVDIISMSFGFTDETEVGCDALSDAIAIAHSRRILMFAAASNMGSHSRPAFPARHSDVFCIFAADGMGNSAPANPTGEQYAPNFSTLGQAVEAAWPRKLVTDPFTRRKSGTSFAVPVAAGIAAMILLYAQQNLSTNEAMKFKEYDKMRDMLCHLSDRRDAYNVISAVGLAPGNYAEATMRMVLAGKWRRR
ncbi:hypothetical protein TGAM01_v202955 [Trichoderma gamsii]|uniref:Uncharacterized protein n=1 Tax=Trichoderma gamsii TaxID=398673 RepID=A0A2P4ZW05_9HYPO|nr:hypothetical protein TGAM01_v202955 [Trichoderma gamsii]PON28461.1 hypothetical protein TGAM01_v202955 [Trichoderma gamsii]